MALTERMRDALVRGLAKRSKGKRSFGPSKAGGTQPIGSDIDPKRPASPETHEAHHPDAEEKADR